MLEIISYLIEICKIGLACDLLKFVTRLKLGDPSIGINNQFKFINALFRIQGSVWLINCSPKFARLSSQHTWKNGGVVWLKFDATLTVSPYIHL